MASEDFELDEKKDKNSIFLPLSQIALGYFAGLGGLYLGGVIGTSITPHLTKSGDGVSRGAQLDSLPLVQLQYIYQGEI